MTKNEKILEIFAIVLNSPFNKISIDELSCLAGSKATKYRFINELTSYTLENDPLFYKIQEGNRDFLVLNKSILKHYSPEHLDTAFFLEAYMKLGHQLTSYGLKQDIKELKNDVFCLNGESEALSRKFYYLDNVNRSSFSNEFVLSTLITALTTNYKVCVSYKNSEEIELYPLSLIQYRDALYIIFSKDETFTQDALRTYKLDRIKSISKTDKKFKYPNNKSWNPENLFKNTSGIIFGDQEEAIIKVFENSRKSISEKVFFNKEALKSTHSYDEYKIKYSNIDELLGQLFVYAQDIEIVSPTSLAEEFIIKAEMAISRNKRRSAA